MLQSAIKVSPMTLADLQHDKSTELNWLIMFLMMTVIVRVHPYMILALAW